MTYYALSSTVLNWLTFNKNVNKYAHNRLLLTSSSSQCRYIQCWTGPEQRHSMVLVSTIFFLLPPFSSPLFTVWLNRKLAALDLQKMPSVNDQVAPAHHNHNQSYHPSYSVATGLPRLIGRCAAHTAGPRGPATGSRPAPARLAAVAPQSFWSHSMAT